MKARFVILIALLLTFHANIAVKGQPGIQHSDLLISDRGPHQQRISYLTVISDPNGSERIVTNSYVQLQTGLNRWDDQLNRYVPANAEIEIVNGHGVVQNTQHRVIFSENLTDPNGTIDLITPGGDRLVTQTVGIALTEADTGKSVFLAEVKPSQGVLIDAHTFIYPDAFDHFKGSIAIRSHLSGIESDVILEEQIDRRLIEQFGINPATARIEVWHQVLLKPEVEREGSMLQRTDGIPDEDHVVHFGQMAIVSGSAYSLGAPELQLSAEGQIPVAKQWIRVEGIDFLIESVPFRQAEEQLSVLPSPAQARVIEKAKVEEALAEKRRQNESLSLSTRSRLRPVSLAAVKRGNPEKHFSKTQVASVTPSSVQADRSGFVIDFPVSLTSQTNLTFRGDTTYWVTGDVGLYGLTTLEGGAVVKFTNYTSLNPVLRIWEDFDCKTSPYNPAIFTAEDDDTVGERISSSTGVPLTSTYYSWFNLWFRWSSTNIFSIHDIHSRYSHVGIGSSRPVQDRIWNVQIFNCDRGIEKTSANLDIRNALVHKTRYAFNTGTGPLNTIFNAEHVTINETARIFLTGATNNCSLRITNSLVANVTTNSIGVISNTVYNVASSAFKSVGRGNHYLTDSTYRNLGTTNLSTKMQEILKRTTTYAPIHLTNDFAGDTTLAPAVQRDTDSPDLGYHYAPLDFLLGERNVTNCAVRLTNGVSVGVYGTSGFYLRDGSRLHSTGRADALNMIVRYQSVQENSSTILGSTGSTMSLIHVIAPNSDPEIQIRFTRANLLANEVTKRHFVNGYSETEVIAGFSVRDSQFRNSYHTHQTQINSNGERIEFLNNIFLRSSIVFYQTNAAGYYEFPLEFRNNLVFGANATFSYGTSGTTWTVKDNLFDTATQWGSVGTFNASHNGYRSAPPGLGGTGNVTLTTTDYVSGPLGDYYYPTTGGNLSSLINAGSQSAPNVKLYHFTTTTTAGSKETNSVVDIGFHYTAVDGSDQAVDSDDDEIPDYMEDSNGNGIFDFGNGETDWETSDSSVSGTALQVFTPLE